MQTNPTILLVENNPSDEASTLRVLTQYRIWNDFAVVSTAREALAYIHGTGAHGNRDARVKPQLIIARNDLPEMSGIDLVFRLRANAATRHVPVILLIHPDDIEKEPVPVGMSLCVTMKKPFRFRHLLQSLQRLGLYWIVTNDPVAA